jgi:hypothetical protein
MAVGEGTNKNAMIHFLTVNLISWIIWSIDVGSRS